MPVTGISKSTDKRLAIASQYGTSQPPPGNVVQSGAQDKSLSQTSMTLP